MTWLSFLQNFLITLSILTGISLFCLIRVIWPRK
jgi:hypothetical protein